MPSLLTRHDYTTWQAEGEKDMAQRVKERVHEIAQTHGVAPLSDEILATFDRIKRDREAGLA
jgi:trimethylamine:corrinoid methyltransferase-like protein